jgi:uncharacterized protein (TIGR02246 family)
MDRRSLLKRTCFMLAGVAGFQSFAGQGTKEKIAIRLDPNDIAKLARDYTAAWNSKSADNVASYYAEDGEIVINHGEPWRGRSRVAEMAAGFFADVPDLSLTCDEIRCAGSHAIYVWTFTGHDAKTGNPLKVCGWEEWDLDEDLKVGSSRGWYDTDDYALQVAGG